MFVSIVFNYQTLNRSYCIFSFVQKNKPRTIPEQFILGYDTHSRGLRSLSKYAPTVKLKNSIDIVEPSFHECNFDGYGLFSAAAYLFLVALNYPANARYRYAIDKNSRYGCLFFGSNTAALNRGGLEYLEMKLSRVLDVLGDSLNTVR